MMKRKYIGQLVSVKFTDKESAVEGIVIDYSDDWLLMKESCFDYDIDGYAIVRLKKIASMDRGSREKWREKVILLKGHGPRKKYLVPLTDLGAILTFLSKKYEVFMFDTKSERSCYLGKLRSINTKELVIDYMTPKGVWAKTMTFRPGDVRIIRFENDYVNSLKLVSKSKSLRSK